MITETCLVLPGRPQPYRSVRSGRNGNRYAAHGPFLRVAREILLSQTKTRAITDALEIDIKFFFERPASHFRKSGGLTPKAPRLMTQRPDIDNHQPE